MDALALSAESPFHPGEAAVQTRLGVAQKMAAAGRRMLRDHMTQQHIDFYPLLPFVLLGAEDGEGRVWATALAGPPGFASADDPRHLRLRARPAADDPVAPALGPGARIGLLGIELHTRRRNRLNGRVVEAGEEGLVVAVDQSFGNCPRYIQARAVGLRPARAGAPEPAVVASAIDEAAGAAIGRADTLFIASVAGGDPADPRRGADVSHRGGLPGFVRVEAADRLVFPDYAGNNLFQTLGNIAADPRVGLLFLDFRTGGAMQLSGTAEIVWDGPAVAAVRGAERLVRVTVDRMVRRPAALPLAASFIEWSPWLPEIREAAEAAKRGG